MLDILVTSRTRRKLLAFFLLNPEVQLHLRQLAREINESPQSTRLEITRFVRAGFMFASGIGRQRLYQLNSHYPYLDELTNIVNKLIGSGYKEFTFTNHARKVLLEKNLNAVTSQLISKYNPEKIIMFGSLARGKVNESTDIDLLIVKDTNKPYYDRIREVTSLCDYNVGIDFLVYNPEELMKMSKTSPFVKNEILKKGRLLYEKAA